MPSTSTQTDLVGSTRKAIVRRLGDGHMAICAVAATLGTNVRTLQRRLAEHGLTYSGLVDEVRLETARRLLRDRSVTLAGIAAALGYSDPAHFSRAFARWTGTTPRAYRRRSQQEDAEMAIGSARCRSRRPNRGLSSNGK